MISAGICLNKSTNGKCERLQTVSCNCQINAMNVNILNTRGVHRLQCCITSKLGFKMHIVKLFLVKNLMKYLHLFLKSNPVYKYWYALAGICSCFCKHEN